MKIGIITKSAWKDMPARVSELAKSLSAKLPGDIELEIIVRDYGAIPADENGRIDAAFLDKTLALPKEFSGACLHVSLKDRRKYRLKKSLRGHYHRDEDGYAEFWLASDRTTRRKGKPQFEETFSHEFCHALYHQLGIPKTPDEDKLIVGHDNTHYFHNVKKNLDLALAEISAAWPKPKTNADIPKDIKLEGLDPKLSRVFTMLSKAMAELGKPIRITEGCRSMERQAELYAQGRTKPGNIVTNAKPGQSKHNFCKAFDVVFTKLGYEAPEKDWQLLGMMGESFNNEVGITVVWGGDWKGFPDRPHFEVA